MGRNTHGRVGFKKRDRLNIEAYLKKEQKQHPEVLFVKQKDDPWTKLLTTKTRSITISPKPASSCTSHCSFSTPSLPIWTAFLDFVAVPCSMPCSFLYAYAPATFYFLCSKGSAKHLTFEIKCHLLWRKGSCFVLERRCGLSRDFFFFFKKPQFIVYFLNIFY